MKFATLPRFQRRRLQTPDTRAYANRYNIQVRRLWEQHKHYMRLRSPQSQHSHMTFAILSHMRFRDFWRSGGYPNKHVFGCFWDVFNTFEMQKNKECHAIGPQACHKTVGG